MIHGYLNHIRPVYGFDPGTTSAAARSSDWLSLKNYRGAILILMAEVGGATDDVQVTVRQAKSNTGTDAKGLLPRTWWRAQAADITTTAGSAVVSVGALTTGVVAEGSNENLIYCEIDSSELDDGFTHVQLQTDDGGAAGKVMGCVLLAVGARHAMAPDELESAIA